MLRYISGLHRQHFFNGRTTELLLKQGYHMHEAFGTAVADVVDFPRRGAGRGIGAYRWTTPDCPVADDP